MRSCRLSNEDVTNTRVLIHALNDFVNPSDIMKKYQRMIYDWYHVHQLNTYATKSLRRNPLTCYSVYWKSSGYCQVVGIFQRRPYKVTINEVFLSDANVHPRRFVLSLKNENIEKRLELVTDAQAKKWRREKLLNNEGSYAIDKQIFTTATDHQNGYLRVISCKDLSFPRIYNIGT